MKTKLVRVEQEEADLTKADEHINAEIKALEDQGHTVKDVKLMVGRDADKTAGLDMRFCVTVILIYE